MNQKGFQLIEVMIAMVILSIASVALMGVLGGALKATGKGEAVTKGLLELEKLMYRLETGDRMDLLLYGGKENVEGLIFDVKSQMHPIEKNSPAEFYDVQIAMKGRSARESWDFQTVLSS